MQITSERRNAIWRKNRQLLPQTPLQKSRSGNIENAAYTPSVCAERCAFFKAVSEGERDFAAIALCGGLKGVVKDYCAPCGVCRQVMREFCKPDFKIILVKSEEEWKVYTLSQLLPEGFGPENLRA